MSGLNTQWIRAVWIPALESGEFAQGTGRLRKTDDRYCCLGVACELRRREGAPIVWRQHPGDDFYAIVGSSLYLPDDVKRFIAMFRSWVLSEDQLASLNDNGATFADIAARLRAACDQADAAKEATTP